MNGRVALVTGANAGIGYATALELARRGARVLCHARNTERGEPALLAMQRSLAQHQELHRGAASGSVELVTGDFLRLHDVSALAESVRDRCSELHVLINNAGVMLSHRRVSEDGFEATLAVNHLAPFALTLRLLPLLEQGAPSRVINVSSGAHRWAKRGMDFDDFMLQRDYDLRRAYGRSKLANILFTRSLAQRMDGRGVTVNCLHPGVVRTKLGRDGDTQGPVALLLRAVGPLLISPEAGAETSIYLASSADVASVSGEYFHSCRRARVHQSAEDDVTAERLWRESERLTGVSFERAAG